MEMSGKYSGMTIARPSLPGSAKIDLADQIFQSFQV